MVGLTGTAYGDGIQEGFAEGRRRRKKQCAIAEAAMTVDTVKPIHHRPALPRVNPTTQEQLTNKVLTDDVEAPRHHKVGEGDEKEAGEVDEGGNGAWLVKQRH